MFNELKRLIKQSSIYGVGAIVSPLVSFIMLPVYTRYLTPEDYGVLALANLAILLLTAVVGLGVRQGILRIYYQYEDKKDRDAVITTSLTFSFMVSLLAAGVMYLTTPLFAKSLFNVPEAHTLAGIINLSTIFSIAGGNFLSVLRVEEKARSYTAITILSLLLTLSLNIVFVVVLKRSVQGVLEAGLISAIVMFSLNGFYVLRGKRYSFSLAKLKEVLGFGAPLVPTLLADITLSLSDRYFLEHYNSLREVGLYSLGYRIAAMLSIVVSKPFNMAWPPYMFKVAKQDNARQIYKYVLVYYVFISSWVGCALSLFAHEALLLLATPAYYESYRIVPVIVVSYMLVGVESIMVAGLHITKKTPYASALFLISAALNLLFNFLLIPRFGMMGAAVSTILSYIFLDGAYIFISQKFYPIDHDFLRLGKILGVYMVISATTYTGIYGTELIISIILKSLVLMAFPAILFLLGFYTREERDKLQQILTMRVFPLFNSLSLKRNK